MADIRKEQERDELHRAIWAIADELRGSVDGWDFKSYVLGMMFYRYISENLTNYINEGEIEAGEVGFDYTQLSDEDAEQAREDLVTSHQTMHTNAVGQFYYCAPEQFMMLKDGDKRSDVYSLGRVINFIMTGDPRNSHHIYRNIAEKATNSDAAYRYADAGQLSIFFEKAVSYKQQAENQTRIDEKITRKVFDDEIESYIYDLSAEKISTSILHEKKGFVDVLLAFMRKSEDHAQYVIQSVDKSYREVCGRSFVAYDLFASFAYQILCGGFSYVVNETAANILRFVARDVNRFSAQHMIDDIKNVGVEPMIEEILDS